MICAYNCSSYTIFVYYITKSVYSNRNIKYNKFIFNDFLNNGSGPNTRGERPTIFFSLDQCTYRYMVFICIDICRDVYILIYSMSLIYVLACMISILLKIKITCTHLLHNIPLHSGWNFYP